MVAAIVRSVLIPRRDNKADAGICALAVTAVIAVADMLTASSPGGCTGIDLDSATALVAGSFLAAGHFRGSVQAAKLLMDSDGNAKCRLQSSSLVK